jgi:hypothetical protein
MVKIRHVIIVGKIHPGRDLLAWLMPTPLLRRSTRAILLDRGGRVLLIRFAGKKFHDPSQNGFEETDYHMLASDRERSVRRS